MKTICRIIAWIFVICGISAYFIGWTALFSKSVIWNIPTEFWFYDAIATGIFGIFFLIYAAHAR